MKRTLRDLASCFEGIIPSVIATSAADGMPNIAYLSHVTLVDDEHVAISNQFFAKTAANIRANPRASLLLVDGRNGTQYRLMLRWERSEDHGALFDDMARDLRTSSAQVGMGQVMRLRAIDIFRVEEIIPCPGPNAEASPQREASAATLADVSAIAAHMTAQTTAEGLIEWLLQGACSISKATHALIAIIEPGEEKLITTASTGYEKPGTGSEILSGNSWIGEAIAAQKTFRQNDMSRMQRFAGAVGADMDEAEKARNITVPTLPGALSRIVVPLCVQKRVSGALLLESAERLAFDKECAAALEILATQAATTLALIERDADAQEPGPEGGALELAGPVVHIVHHAFDDSIFIDGSYVIKGLAGRLLMFLVDRAIEQKRDEFTNREIRLASELKLPEFKDNLETRLLLLRRRLDENAHSIRLVRTGRGKMRLILNGTPRIDRR